MILKWVDSCSLYEMLANAYKTRTVLVLTISSLLAAISINCANTTQYYYQSEFWSLVL